MSKLYTILFAFLVAALHASPAFAAAKTVCFQYPVLVVDSGIGEDHLPSGGGIVPAAFGHVVALQFGAGPQSVYNLDLNNLGCATFEVTNLGRSWTFAMNVAANIDGNTVQVFTTAGVQANFGINWTAPTSWTTRTFDHPLSRISNLMGIATFALIRNPIVLSSGHTIRLHDADCPSRPGRSCAGATDMHFTLDHTFRKYVVAHELGHIVMNRVGGMPASGSNMSNPRGEFTTPNPQFGGATCEWFVDDHMMHSWEWSTAAYVEGWAQFYATATWNDNSGSGFYQYHKQATQFGGIIVTPPGTINMESGGNHLGTCDCGGSCAGRAAVKLGSGTELDWSRQFWDFHSDAGTKPPYTFLLFGLAIGGPDMTTKERAWNSMKFAWQTIDAAWATTFFARWDATDATNGINYCATGSNC